MFTANSSFLFLSLLIWFFIRRNDNAPGGYVLLLEVEGFLHWSSSPSLSFPTSSSSYFSSSRRRVFDSRQQHCPLHQLSASENNNNNNDDNETPPQPPQPPQQNRVEDGDQPDLDASSNKGLIKRLQNVTGKATLQVVKGGGRSKSKIVSTASDLVGKGGSAVQSAYSVTSTYLTNIAESSADRVVTTRNNIVELVDDLATKGGSGIQSTVSKTSDRISDIVEMGSSSVNSVATNVVTITNTTSYNAGEIIRWIEGQAKGGVNVANTQSRAIVLNFTGKKEYKFGDITKELLRRIVTTEIDMNDVTLLLKILLTAGAGFAPVAKVLPITVLLEMLNISLEKQIGGKVLQILASSLDERFSVAFFNNDDKFQMGDAVKRSAMSAILNFTGKDSYHNGDIGRAVAKNDIDFNDDGNKKQDATNNVQDGSDDNNRTTSTVTSKTLNISVGPEFEEWDDRFRKAFPQSDDLEEVNSSSKLLDIAVARELVYDNEFAMPSPTDDGPSSITTKFCIFCGTRLPAVANFCSSCGERQP